MIIILCGTAVSFSVLLNGSEKSDTVNVNTLDVARDDSVSVVENENPDQSRIGSSDEIDFRKIVLLLAWYDDVDAKGVRFDGNDLASPYVSRSSEGDSVLLIHEHVHVIEEHDSFDIPYVLSNPDGVTKSTYLASCNEDLLCNGGLYLGGDIEIDSITNVSDYSDMVEYRTRHVEQSHEEDPVVPGLLIIDRSGNNHLVRYTNTTPEEISVHEVLTARKDKINNKSILILKGEADSSFFEDTAVRVDMYVPEALGPSTYSVHELTSLNDVGGGRVEFTAEVALDEMSMSGVMHEYTIKFTDQADRWLYHEKEIKGPIEVDLREYNE